MEHVLVIEGDAGIEAVLGEALREEGYTVSATSDPVLALALLWLSERPLVVLLDAQLHASPMPLADLGLLDLAAQDETGRLSRHGYILLSTLPRRLESARRDLLSRMGAPVLSLPFDLADLFALVAQVADRMRARPMRVLPARGGATSPTAALVAEYMRMPTLAAHASARSTAQM